MTCSDKLPCMKRIIVMILEQHLHSFRDLIDSGTDHYLNEHNMTEYQATLVAHDIFFSSIIPAIDEILAEAIAMDYPPETLALIQARLSATLTRATAIAEEIISEGVEQDLLNEASNSTHH